MFLINLQLNFLTQYQKPQLYVDAKVVSQEDSKFVDHVLQGVKKAFFFTLNIIFLQFMLSTFLNLFPLIILIVQSKILWLNSKKKIQKNPFMQFVLDVQFWSVLF
jgi:hypothetical protein